MREVEDSILSRAPEHDLEPSLDRIAAVEPGFVGTLAALGGQPSREPFTGPIGDFYLTNPIARASGVMAECSALARGARLEAAE